MDVLRYDDITHQGESVTVAHFPQKFDENILGVSRTQHGQPPTASERDEMQMSASVVANEIVGH